MMLFNSFIFFGFNFYRPQRSCGQGYVFTRVCDSVNRGGLRRTPPGTRQTPRQGEPPPGKKTAAYGQWYASYWNAYLSYIFFTLLNLADAQMGNYNEYFIHLLVNINTMDTVFVNDMYGSWYYWVRISCGTKNIGYKWSNPVTFTDPPFSCF